MLLLFINVWELGYWSIVLYVERSVAFIFSGAPRHEVRLLTFWRKLLCLMLCGCVCVVVLWRCIL